ncbi:acyl dehydratase MaoC [Salinarchaeum sp. Harcht-Bsk1]|uniref:MaoC family dehydratase n=1 Tax=Salinarchaeum sp. Harcht-Bsk1 TaxID=1333523 RepID=UPI0003423AC3|nr:MaoC family dehydratase [Salinarchaeum sp. Harcht-Bsk1]AGN00144.1 acyl dehydratase MaoC [Salinarchaeum sp. Harcht-Bsk1]
MSDTRGVNGFTAVADAWMDLTSTVVRNTAAANRAAFSAFVTEDESNGDGFPEETVPSVAGEEPDWTFERSVDRREDIGVGDTVTFSKRLTDEDVHAFGRASGDTNRLHLDDDFAQRTRFGGRIVHGTLASGLISAALARLPGLTIYLSQDLKFSAPVGIGDRVSANVEVVEDLGENQYRLTTEIHDEDEDTTIIDGEAVVLIDDLPEE